jgi:alpha-L-fucosidase 2
MCFKIRFAFYACLAIFFTMQTAHAQLTDKIDWRAFMSRHDMIWNKMPKGWDQGAFLGNGQLGAMIFGDSKSVHFRIGRTDVTFHGNRIPVGELLLTPVGKITGFSMRLDLWNAQVLGHLTTDQGEIKFRAFTHAAQMVQVISLSTTGDESKSAFTWVPGLAESPRTIFRKEKPLPTELNPPPVRSDTDGVSMSFQPLRDGGGHATAWKEIPGANGQKVLLLSVGFSTKDGDAQTEAIADIATAEKTGIESLTSSHQDWWHHYYPESFVSIPDTRLESFYWAQMYKLASATRADRPAIDLMGPWTNATPWPRIWWNLNLQLTYWPVLTSNRLELGESLCKLLDSGADNLAKNAGEFSSDSATVARSTSYDCVGAGGNELCNLPWILHNYYLQYRYSMDRDMLRDHIFPLLKRSINFYLHQLAQGPDGKLHITRGYSPEYPDQPTPDPDCNIDLSLLRWGCQTLLATCEQLKIDDPLIPKWKATLENLTPYPTDENGLRISASVPFAESHRHYSHLLMIFPLYIMNPEQPANHDLVIKSLNHWMGMPKALQGYSYTGAASISALLGHGDEAVNYLNKLLDKRILPNAMYTESGPVIETPLSAAASLHDMLLSSWGDRIRVFPAVPAKWSDVTFHNLRAQGAFLVSAIRRGGKTQFVQVTSLAGEPCRIWTDMTDPVVDADVKMHAVGDGVIQLDLSKGGSAVIYPKGSSSSAAITAVADQADHRNYYGVK